MLYNNSDHFQPIPPPPNHNIIMAFSTFNAFFLHKIKIEKKLQLLIIILLLVCKLSAGDHSQCLYNIIIVCIPKCSYWAGEEVMVVLQQETDHYQWRI